MRILVQWATNPPGGWQEIDSWDWSSLPKRPEPPVDRSPTYDSGEAVVGFTGADIVLDDQPGWVNRICIQGMVFTYDHIAVIHHDDHIEVIGWNDDVVDWDATDFVAYCWKFYPAEEHKTTQFLVVYAGSAMKEKIGGLITGGRKVSVLAWSEFVPPDDQYVRHGIWMTDEQYEAHKKTRTPGWREWIGDPV